MHFLLFTVSYYYYYYAVFNAPHVCQSMTKSQARKIFKGMKCLLFSNYATYIICGLFYLYYCDIVLGFVYHILLTEFLTRHSISVSDIELLVI